MSNICNTTYFIDIFTFDNLARYYQIGSFHGFSDSLLNSHIWIFNLSNLQITEDKSKAYRLI